MARILIVEDHDGVAGVLSEVLADEGHEVACAAATGDALIAAADTAPDLVLMDILLNDGFGGVVCALALRGLGIAAPILVVTGGLAKVNPKLYAAAGFAEQLQKPFMPDDLLAAVERQLGGPTD